MPTPKRRSPHTVASSVEAQNKNSAVTVSHLFREFIAILAVGAMVGVMFWTSVFGATGQFGPGPEISINERLAAGGDDGR